MSSPLRQCILHSIRFKRKGSRSGAAEHITTGPLPLIGMRLGPPSPPVLGDGLYEEVNKPQLRGHYIGLHQESSSKRTAAAAAFVCFKRATARGEARLQMDLPSPIELQKLN